MALTESEIISRHVQALGEAREACQYLGRNADPEYLQPRGHHYGNLRRALNALEGSARQMAHFRSDARWLRLGIVYAKAMRTIQIKFVGQKWDAFNKLLPLFESGLRSMNDLKDTKTAKLGSILPARPSDWLWLPDEKVPWSRGESVH